MRYLRDEFAAGRGEVFAFGPQADMQNSSQVIAYASQAGIALPERAYYLEDGKDGSYKRIRAAYVAHLAKQLRHAGVATADAGRQAELVLAFETRLAKASLVPVELRDPTNQYHFVTIAEADRRRRISPGPRSCRAGPQVEGFSLSQPKFFAEIDKMLADVPVADWQAYLRYHTVDDSAPFLSDASRTSSFDFYGKTLQRAAGAEAALEARARRDRRQHGRGPRPAYVERDFPPSPRQRCEAAGDEPARRR